MRTLLLALLVLQTAAPQFTRTPRQWTTIRDGDAGLTAEFPSPPIRETQANGMVRWMVQLDNDHHAYIAGMIGISGERMTAGTQRLLDDAVAGGVRNVPGGELLQDRAITHQSHPGREILVKAPGPGGPMRIVSRAIIAGNRLYLMTCVGPFDAYDVKEFDRFLASLRLM